MTIDEITHKIIESKNNDIAKTFTMHIGSLLINNGIVPIMTEYTGTDVKNIKNTDEYKFIMEYGIAFNELDCSKHDKEIYNKAVDDFYNKIIEAYEEMKNIPQVEKSTVHTIALGIMEQLKNKNLAR